jgi:hypothetical protein
MDILLFNFFNCAIALSSTEEKMKQGMGRNDQPRNFYFSFKDILSLCVPTVMISINR